MIREEYSMPPQATRGVVWRKGRGVMRRAPKRDLLRLGSRLGVLLVLAVLGIVCTGIVDSSGIKARVLAGIASACSNKAGVYSLLQEHHSASAKSRSSVAVCEELVRLKPGDASAHVMLGNAYVDTGCMQEASACYQKALALDPNCFEAHLGMGKAHFDRGRYSEAIESYRKALKIRPRSADAHLSLGLALSNAGKYEEAMQAFQKAKELDSTVVETQVMMGKACLQVGMCAQAIQCFKEAVQADQGHAQAYFNLGRAYLRVGDTGLAMEQQRILQGLDSQLADQLMELIHP
jgi:superkiller protein 3